MSETETTELVELVERFFHAYNDVDMDTLAALLTDDVHWEHHNRFTGDGREPLLSSIQQISDKMPDRHFSELSRWAVNGNVVFCEHRWFTVPLESDPNWGWEAGVPFSMDAASVFVVTDGLIVEWSDYG